MTRYRVVYWILIPAILVAAGVLAYFAWQTASQYARLGERTILESTLLLVKEKVDQVDRSLIAADNAVMATVDLDAPSPVPDSWPPVAEEVAPTITDLLVIDEVGTVLGHAGAGSAPRREAFRKVLLERVLPDLELERQRTGRLKHLHRTYAGKSYLLSYEARVHRGRRYYVLAHHDTGKVREQLAQLFATDEGKRSYNIVDEDNRRVYGPSLAGAGDYLVGARFPTTLYGWRLQVAPKQAPLLESQGRTRRFNEVALVATAITVLLLGVAFVLYATHKERTVNALKAEFVANVSHELKTPLSVIRMFAEMLASRRVRSEAKHDEYVGILCRESERLSALVENVLDFAALESGRRTFELKRGDLWTAVTAATETFAQRTDTADVRPVAPSEPLPPVRLDEQAVILATVNLLDNAAKYGDGTPITVSVERRRGRLEVVVRDRGPGIPGEDLRRVFDRFYRSRRDGDVRGSGIGLSLVRHIAEAHGGRAWAENAPDGGARVAFDLPIPRAPRPRVEATPSSEDDGSVREPEPLPG